MQKKDGWKTLTCGTTLPKTGYHNYMYYSAEKDAKKNGEESGSDDEEEYGRHRDPSRVFKMAKNGWEPLIDDSTYLPDWKWCYCLHDSAKFDGQWDE